MPEPLRESLAPPTRLPGRNGGDDEFNAYHPVAPCSAATAGLPERLPDLVLVWCYSTRAHSSGEKVATVRSARSRMSRCSPLKWYQDS